MRKTIARALPAGLILALPFALAPATAVAQEEGQEPVVQQETEIERCTVTFDSQDVAQGEAALRLQGDLEGDIGEVEGLEAGESGIVLATREDIRGVEVEMAARPEEPPTEEPVPAEEAEEQAPEVRPIETSPDGSRVTVWLNTEAAVAGTHAVTLKGAEGECTARLTVEGDAEAEAETEELQSEQPPVQPPAEERGAEQPEGEQPVS